MTTSRSDAGDKRLVRIVAAIVVNAEGKTLLVRKRGTAAFMLPGGKPSDGEMPLDALQREIFEELGCGLERSSCRSLGHFHAPAASEPGFSVEAELFDAALVGEISPGGEIEEAVWIDPRGEVHLPLAPLTRDHAIPLSRGLSQKRA